MKKLVLSAAFIVLGTFAMAQTEKFQKMDPAKMEQKRAEKMQKMKADLGLSDDQVAKIKALQDKKMEERKANAPQLQAERAAKAEQFKAKKEQYKAEMKAILTPEQYQKWEAKKHEGQDKMRDKMKERKIMKESQARISEKN